AAQLFAQSVPLMAKTAGAGSWPVSVPLNPMLTVPPFAGMLAFQLSAVTVTCCPDCDQVPSQPLCTPSPAGKVKVSCQVLIAVLPLFVRVMLALKPPDQLLFTA